MTDYDAQMNMSSMERVGIPSQLIGGDRPASIEARKTYHASPAENDTNQPGSTVRFTLPNQPNTYLMPDVNFTFTMNIAGNIAGLDLDASGIIERYRLFCGSQLLVDIPEYSRLCRIIEDVTQNPTNGKTISCLLKDAPNGAPTSAQMIAGNSGTTQRAYSTPAYPDNQGIGIAGHHMVVPLMCPLIGTMAQKAYPSHASTAAPLRVEIDLCSNAKGLVSIEGGGALATYTLTNTQLKATYVQVSSNAQALIDQAVGGVYALNTSSYAHSQSGIAQNDTNANILLPFSYSSVKHFLTGIYHPVDSQEFYNISGRGRQGISSAFYQIGASRVPSQPMDTDKEIGEHLCKCFGVSTNLLQVSNYLTRLNFLEPLGDQVLNLNTNVPGTHIGKFAIGIDLEAFGATSSATRVENGINTTALQCFINFTTTAVSAAKQVHSWCCYDMLVTFANGQAYARF